MRKHVTRALIIFWKFLSRKIIIELHFNLNTTVPINTVNLFIHRTIFIVYIIRGGGEYCRAPICMKPCIPYQKCTAEVGYDEV